MNFYRLPEKIPLQDPIDLSKELFMKSFERFDGDVARFNGDPTNNFTMYAHNGGFIHVWKSGVTRKLVKEFTKALNLPVYQFGIVYTPANGTYTWHSEHSEHVDTAPEEFQDIVLVRGQLRRNVAINFKLLDHDLSESKIMWAKTDPRVTDILKRHYPKVSGIGNTHDLIANTYDTKEGIKIRLSHSYIDDESLIEVEDELYDMEVPTLVNTAKFHKIDNTKCPHDRIMASVCLHPEHRFAYIQKLLQYNTQ
jgi:hypothetical protein